MSEHQYQSHWKLIANQGRFSMPCRATTMWARDPKLLLFTLSRHKFVAKMLQGYQSVLEVGCGDGFASRLIQPCVGNLSSIDFDPAFIDEARLHSRAEWNVDYHVHNILEAPFLRDSCLFDAAFSLDVFEHIPSELSDLYATNIKKSISDDGVFICGCPSLESQAYASEESKQGHVNCMNGIELKRYFSGYFKHVFLFSMNDEVLHTGFSPMAHYSFVICTAPL
jgi:SAM-dependent methyltransferase